MKENTKAQAQPGTSSPKNQESNTKVKPVPGYLYGAVVEGAKDLDKYWEKRDKERIVLSNSPRVKKLARTAARKSAITELPPTDDESESSLGSVFSGSEEIKTPSKNEVTPAKNNEQNANSKAHEKRVGGANRKEIVGPKMILNVNDCLLYTSPSPRDGLLSRMPSSA